MRKNCYICGIDAETQKWKNKHYCETCYKVLSKDDVRCGM